jgi:uncharacterized alkaline shock family protein YloU
MEGFDSHDSGGSLQISSEVVEKIARNAAMEVEGVHNVIPAASVAAGLLGIITPPKPIVVVLKNDVADITVSIQVEHGTIIPELSERVQQSVKEAVQSMTSISVAKVDVLIAGLAGERRSPA